MRVLVTGASGFIGDEILKTLISNFFDVIGTSKNGGGNTSSRNLIRADITDKEKLEREIGGHFDVIIHCAGLAHQFGKIEKTLFDLVNVEGTKNISELAVKLKVKQFILISSTAVYGLQQKATDESAECRPDTDYAESKLRAEIVCREICEKNNIDLTIFRLAPVLGEKGIGNVPRLIGAIENGRFIWVGNGKNKKSLVYVSDIAEACLQILKAKRTGTEIFNLASPPVEMRELVSLIARALNKKIPKISIPEFVPKTFVSLNNKIIRSKFLERYSKIFDKWLSDDVYPADKIKAEYGFEPKTAIADAVGKQCEWYLEQKKSN